MLITGTELISRVRSGADQQYSGFISDTEIINWLNVGVQELYDILTHEVTDYAVISAAYDTISGSDSYLLPDDFYRLRGVEIQITPNQWVTIKRFNFSDRNIYKPFGFSYLRAMTNVMYRLWDNYIHFIPGPTFPFSAFQIWYVPSLQKLQSPDSTVSDWGGGFEEYAVVHGIIQCKIKEESDCNMEMTQKSQLKDRLLSINQERDNSQAEHIQDFRRQDILFPYGMGGGVFS